MMKLSNISYSHNWADMGGMSVLLQTVNATLTPIIDRSRGLDGMMHITDNVSRETIITKCRVKTLKPYNCFK